MYNIVSIFQLQVKIKLRDFVEHNVLKICKLVCCVYNLRVDAAFDDGFQDLSSNSPLVLF